MLRKTILLCIFGLVFVKCVEMDHTTIHFKIEPVKDNNTKIMCDHTETKMTDNKYTALEGGTITFITSHTYINLFSCTSSKDLKKIFVHNSDSDGRNFSIPVTANMSTSWKCMIWSNKNNYNIHPRYKQGNDSYSEVYCYLRVHVRRIMTPQTILVNKMVVKPVRNDLLVKDVDYTVEYEYTDGDLVDVTCSTLLGQNSMEYDYAENLSNEFKIIKSPVGTGMRAKLNSRFHNTHMICTYEADEDVTRTNITFIMRPQIQKAVSVKINGIKSILNPTKRDHYQIEYKYVTDQKVNVACHAERDNMTLKVNDTDIMKLPTFKRYGNSTDVEVSFVITSAVNISCEALSQYDNNDTEITQIVFTEDRLIDLSPLHMNLPPNGTVLELYGNNERRVIYYEYEEDETLTLNCYTIPPEVGPPVYVTFNETERWDTFNISKTVELSSLISPVKTCYLIQKPSGKKKSPNKARSITVIFHKKPIYNETTTTAGIFVITTPSNASEELPEDNDGSSQLWIGVGVVTVIVVIGVIIIIYKLAKRSRKQAKLRENNYENFQNQNEVSIPAHPTQWETNYAVPVDQRPESDTYSEPIKPEAAMYATPIPKCERKKKQKSELIYSSLHLNPCARKNVFKDGDDPNYSEIGTNLEQNYSQVLPKSKRNVHHENDYANTANKNPHVNVDEPEPMYCEPNTAQQSQKRQYVNVNNARYANTPAHEYVEPTYCELNTSK